MAANIVIKVSGIQEFVNDYGKFKKDMRENMVVPLDTSAMKYLQLIHANFNNRGATFGETWPPLSPATIAEKKRLLAKGKSKATSRPLVRTGKLERGFGRKVVKSADEAYVYNAQPYAIVHQEGQTVQYRGRNVQVPRRVLAEVDDDRIEIVARIFLKWFNSIVASNKM